MEVEGSDNELFDLLKFIWNINVYKQTLREYHLDVDKMPLGVL